MAARKKAPASVRTVDMFSGRTLLEEEEEKARIAADADLEEAGKEREPQSLESVNKQAERWMSTNFEKELDGWRLSRAHGGTYYLLEKLGFGGAYTTGICIPAQSIPFLATAFGEAAKHV